MNRILAKNHWIWQPF